MPPKTNVDVSFCRRLPKCELHAHLSGSISRESLHYIWVKRKQKEPDLELEDPLTALAPEKLALDINTFFPLFTNCIYKLRSTVATLIYTTWTVLSSFQDDGVCYLELRTTPQALSDCDKNGYVETVLKCMRQFQITSYLILSIDRKNSSEEAMEVVDLAIKHKDSGVVGVDLCGNPATPLDIEGFRPAFAKAKAHGLKVTLHFAETVASASDEELEALLSYAPDRIGHVIHVNERLKEVIRRRKLGLELCPAGNAAAGLTKGGFSAHHVAEWLKMADAGPVALCTDDVGLFLNPLSREYLLLAQNFGLTRNDLIDLCGKTSGAIFAGEEEKQKIRGLLKEFRSAGAMEK